MGSPDSIELDTNQGDKVTLWQVKIDCRTASGVKVEEMDVEALVAVDAIQAAIDELKREDEKIVITRAQVLPIPRKVESRRNAR